MDIASDLKHRLGDAFLQDEPLSKHTTFKIGGPAKYFVHAKTKELLMNAFRAARQLNIPFFILGGGSNILVSDKGFDGLIIRTENDEFKVEGENVLCGAGLPLAKLVKQSIDAGLSGCEWAIVIPGYVGGSIRGNAGAYKGDFSQITYSVEAFDGERIKTYDHEAIAFRYRDSIFKHQENQDIILSAVLKLKKGEKAQSRQTMMAHLNKKNTEHPMGLPSAGCVFKNVELIPGSYELKDPSQGRPSDFFKSEVPDEFIQAGKVPTGFLIEALDLKGKQIGGVQVSPKHCNYIVNIGEGKAEDVIILTSLIKQKVRTAFGVQLKEEIQLVGF